MELNLTKELINQQRKNARPPRYVDEAEYVRKLIFSVEKERKGFRIFFLEGSVVR